MELVIEVIVGTLLAFWLKLGSWHPVRIHDERRVS
jgi:hypothetical protein